MCVWSTVEGRRRRGGGKEEWGRGDKVRGASGFGHSKTEKDWPTTGQCEGKSDS